MRLIICRLTINHLKYFNALQKGYVCATAHAIKYVFLKVPNVYVTINIVSTGGLQELVNPGLRRCFYLPGGIINIIAFF